MRILLVEDSRTSVLMVQSLLNEDAIEHYDLTVAKTVSDAVLQLAQDFFDLILLDLTLPDSYGLATVDTVVAAAKSTPIVVLTSTSDEEIGLAALKHGAQDFLIKDETYRKVLLRAIKYALQRAIAEREVREAKELAEFATRSKSTFIANLSHELRTPLNAVIGFSELMVSGMAGDMSEKQKEYAQDIYKAGKYLNGLIGTVLDISKIEADKLELHNGQVDMASLINDVVERVQGAYRNDKIAFEIDIDDNIPVVTADQMMMAQIVTNLVSNAVKYSPEGGQVSVHTKLNGLGQLVLKVSDQGMGIAKDDIELVLQPFGRTQAARQHKIDGTGLGLSLTKGLVEAHGGALAIESILGEGTTVAIMLPPSRLAS